jgi:hypothetical protein
VLLFGGETNRHEAVAVADLSFPITLRQSNDAAFVLQCPRLRATAAAAVVVVAVVVVAVVVAAAAAVVAAAALGLTVYINILTIGDYW